MAPKKRGATEESGGAKRRRVSEATAAADRPRRTAKPSAPRPEPKAKEPSPQKTTSKTKPKPKAKATKPSGAPKPAKVEVTKKPESVAKSTTTSDATEDSNEGPSYWLMKAEPETRLEKGIDVKFSIDDLASRKEPEPWDGVRNPVAQKNMRTMKKGELGFFYHSNCKVPGIAGVLRIVREYSVDESAFDPKHPYFDPKSSRDKPKWSVVHVEHVRTFDELIPLKMLQQHRAPGEPLADMQVLRMSRLSVSKVSEAEWTYILKELAGVNPQSLEDAN